MAKLFYLLLMVCFGFVMSETFTKLLVFSENSQWVPLGKFTKSAEINARIKTSSKPWAPVDKKLILHIVAYSPTNWANAIKGKGCSSLLEHMNGKYELKMSTDATWSDSVELDFFEPTMYLVASICESPNFSELLGFGIQFEIEGCDVEPLSAEDLEKLQGTTHPLPVTKHYEGVETEHTSRFMFFNTAALLFFILSIVVSQMATKGLLSRQFMFQFPILIGSIIARIIMHGIIIIDSYTDSEIIDGIVVFLDVFSQYAFIFSSIITILGYLSESIGQSIITLILLSLIYCGLGFTKRWSFVVILRLLLLAGAGSALGYGLSKSEQPRNIKLASLVTVVVYILALLLVEMDLLSCMPNSSVLIDRFYLLKSYRNCSSPLHWVVEGDHLIQAIIMGATLFIMRYLTRDR